MERGGSETRALSVAKANCARLQGTSQPSIGVPKSVAIDASAQSTKAALGSLSG